ELVTYLSSVSHLDSFSRGTVELKDVVYFLSICALGLFASHRAVEAHRWSCSMYTTDSAGYRLSRILGVLGITALLSALTTGVFIAGPKDPRTWVQLVIGLGGIGAYLWVNLRRVRDRFSGRGTFFLASSLVTGALVL